MLQTVDVGERSLDAYRSIAPDEMLDELVREAVALRGARVLHINATPYGGGVSELLRSMVPLLNDLGLIADWKVISGDDAFFGVTKKIHNGLQGAPELLTDAERAAYERTSERNAELLHERYDFVFIHDPQPAAILPLHGKGDARWIWRCHIDTSEPNPDTWMFLRDYLTEYDAAVFTMDEFTPPDFPIARVEIMPPAIDPLSPKNLELPEATARQILGWIGVRMSNPLITQVSRFDPWKDPLGVIQAYRLAREEVPNLALVLAGSMALDDPEGWDVYQEIMAESASDPLIHVFTNLTGVGNIEVNAFQRLSDVIVQKSIREGFGLVVSEALWKGTPVVAGRAGGIPLQLANGLSELLVDTVEETAATIIRLLRNPEHAQALGARGRERVRQHFLLPRLLLNEISLMLDLARARPIERDRVLPAGATRDPVCGMVLTEDQSHSTAVYQAEIYTFCSEYCQRRFQVAPERYALTQ
jgi:trehalose synthase